MPMTYKDFLPGGRAGDTGRAIFHGPLVTAAVPASAWTPLLIDANNGVYIGGVGSGPSLDVLTAKNFRFCLECWAELEMNLSFDDPTTGGLVGFRYTPWVYGGTGTPVINCQSSFSNGVASLYWSFEAHNSDLVDLVVWPNKAVNAAGLCSGYIFGIL